MHPDVPTLIKERQRKLAELTQAENRARHWKRCAAELQREIGRIEIQLSSSPPPAPHRGAPLTRQEEW